MNWDAATVISGSSSVTKRADVWRQLRGESLTEVGILSAPRVLLIESRVKGWSLPFPNECGLRRYPFCCHLLPHKDSQYINCSATEQRPFTAASIFSIKPLSNPLWGSETQPSSREIPKAADAASAALCVYREDGSPPWTAGAACLKYRAAASEKKNQADMISGKRLRKVTPFM